MKIRSVNGQFDISFIRPEHSRAARAWLGWTLHAAQEKSGLALDTISRYERGAIKVSRSTLERLYVTYRRAGVELRADGIRAEM